MNPHYVKDIFTPVTDGKLSPDILAPKVSKNLLFIDTKDYSLISLSLAMWGF